MQFVESETLGLQDEGEGGVPAGAAALLGAAVPSDEEAHLWQTERLR